MRNLDHSRVVEILEIFSDPSVAKLSHEHYTECKDNDKNCTESGPKTEHKEVTVVFKSDAVVDPRAVMVYG